MLRQVNEPGSHHENGKSTADSSEPFGSAVPIADTDDQNLGRKILGGGIVRVAGFGLSTVFGIIAISIISREIGPAEFALFTTAMSLIAIATSFSDFGLLALGIREYAALDDAARERSLRALITMRFVFAAVASSGIVAFAVLAGYPRELVVGLAVAALGLTIMSLHQSFNVPLHALYKLNTLAAIDIGRQAMVSGGMIAAAVLAGTAGAIVSIYLPVGIVMALVSGFVAHRYATLKPSLDWPMMQNLLKDVGAFAVAASVGTIYAYIAQVVADSILDPDASGQFALAFRIYAVLLGAGMTGISGAFPLLVVSSRDDHDRMVYATRRLLQTSVLAGFVCTVGLVTGAGLAVAVLGGAEYDGAVDLIRIIGVAIPASFVLITGSSLLLASRRHRELVVISVVGAVASIAATAAMTASMGVNGAALGIVIGESLIAAGYVVVMLRIDRRAVPKPRWLLGAVLAAVVGCAPALTGLVSVFAATAGVALFTAACLILRVVPPEILDRVRNPRHAA